MSALDNIFKLKTKYEFDQLDRLKVVLNVFLDISQIRIYI